MSNVKQLIGDSKVKWINLTPLQISHTIIFLSNDTENSRLLANLLKQRSVILEVWDVKIYLGLISEEGFGKPNDKSKSFL
jgi:hypothetical protein